MYSALPPPLFSTLSLMFHFLGYELSRNVGRYASRTKFIELEVNGDYLGAYVFMEKLKRDKNRINIKKLDDDDNVQIKMKDRLYTKN